jgi:hypothetical protein
LHRGIYHKFKGYAYSQLAKAERKRPEEGSKRAVIIEKYGWDVKFGYHVVRLLGECEQILGTGELDLRVGSEYLRAIRSGEVSYEEVKEYFIRKEGELERLYEGSKLPYGPREGEIKELLLECLEEGYGSLEGII